MIAPVLWLGFLLGVRHALEADHLAAVATLATRSATMRDAVRVAAAWGIGHAGVLLVAGAALILVGSALPPSVARGLEALVGAMLMGLGIDALRRLRKGARGVEHNHVEHVHHDEAAHRGLVQRALVVGGVHGMEGSGALVLAALPAFPSSARATLYLLIFGVGSIAGMVGCTLALALPLGVSMKQLTRFGRALQVALGGATIALGGWMVIGAIRS